MISRTGFSRLAAAWCLLVLLVLPHGPSFAEPKRVEVGIWLASVHSIDMSDGRFGAEFYIWWISEDADFRPFATMQVLNGRQWNVRSIQRRKLPDGRHHTSGIVSATVNHAWDLHYFPFDRQKLTILIETPNTAAEMRMVPDRKGSTISDFLKIEGYAVTGLDLSEKVEKYRTNFGIPGASGNQFSRLVVTIGIDRNSDRLVVVLLIGFIVANVVALLTYAIHVPNIAIRVALSGGAIFAAVGNMYLLNSALDPAVGSLIVDRFALGTFTAIVAALLTAIVVERLDRFGKSRRAKSVNQSIFVVVLIASLAYYGWSFHAALHGAS